jgi:hypothetical protein
MPLSIDQYAAYLDTRDLPWPVAPDPDPPKAKPYLPKLSGIRAVVWTVYGTLLRLTDGELKFEHENSFIMEVSLEKTIHEFKMWNSMSRKPGQPSAYMKEIYLKILSELKLAPSMGEKYPEILCERIWENIIKKLLQKEYKFDAGMYGSLNEYAKKIAYFFHASMQGTACYPGAAGALRDLADAGVINGLLGDGQCFTCTQLARGLQQQEDGASLENWVPPRYRFLSWECGARKPSETILRLVLQEFAKQGIESWEILHVGSNLARDIVPAKKAGLRTALFAGDKQSLVATSDQLKDAANRPDVMLTELSQLPGVLV